MAAQTGIPEDRVKRSYLRLHRAGFGVPTPAATPDELRDALAQAARALQPLAAAQTLDEQDPTEGRDEWTSADALIGEVWDARDAIIRVEALLYHHDREAVSTLPAPALSPDSPPQPPPPLGFARRVQVPKGLLIDTVQEVVTALAGPREPDRLLDTLEIVREELQSWADEDFNVGEVARITAARLIGDAVIRDSGHPTGTALRRLVTAVEQAGQIAKRRVQPPEASSV